MATPTRTTRIRRTGLRLGALRGIACATVMPHLLARGRAGGSRVTAARASPTARFDHAHGRRLGARHPIDEHRAAAAAQEEAKEPTRPGKSAGGPGRVVRHATQTPNGRCT